MKTLLTLFTACLFVCFMTDKIAAQTVTIPDANFAAYLNTIIPSAMSGNQMNTASPAVTGLTSINVENMGIADLTGVQYFASLITLDCGNGSPSIDSNMLVSLPTLPSTLDTLICGNNQLTSLPALPSGLQYLACYINDLTSMPALPSSLTYLDCDNNFYLSNLPATLPNNLGTLFCAGDLLTSLPTLSGTQLTYLDCDNNYSLSSIPTLPNTLQTLYCDYDELSSLPNLPGSLQELFCDNNGLSSLPALPGSVWVIYCTNNQLTSLPGLPNGLSTLICDNNQFLSLPALPSGLQNLSCSYNQLTNLPNIPQSLTHLICNNNQLTSLPTFPEQSGYLLGDVECQNNNISCFPIFPSYIGTFNISGNPFTCLPNYIPAMDPATLAYPLCGLGNPNGCTSAYGIVGYAYDDMNGNCIKDAGDSALRNIPVQLYDNNNNLLSQTYTALNGVYDFPDTLAGTYAVVIDTTAMPYTVQCSHPGADSIITFSGGLDTNVNFALTCKPSFDVGVQAVVETGLVFPGLQHDLYIIAGDISHWYNLNCASGVSGTVQITVSGPVTYVGPGTGALTPAVSGDTYTYTIADYGSVNNLTAFNLLFTTNNNAQAGDNVCVNVNITPTVGDNDTANNAYNYCYTVVNSHDPNSKEVYPVNVKPGYTGWLTYTVHFQNTGNAAANNIMLKDTLDSKLDLSTFQLLSYSSQNTVSLTGNVLTVRFNNINLPDSAGSPTGSIGYIQYRIKPKTNEPYGASIKNTAYVYFDFNAPVITDTTNNIFNVTASVDNILADGFSIRVFPNPNNGKFVVTCHPAAITESLSIQVYNVLGENIITETLRSTQGGNSIDLSTQPNGVYMYRILTQNGSLVGEGKLIITK